MIVTGSRLRQIGWIMVLAICFAMFLALKFRVDAVKSDVRLAEREIVTLESNKVLLETEFETRSNQQQLARWNTVDFGYNAPKAEQFVENERQLAVLGTPRGVDAPDPIRVAHAPEEGDIGMLPVMVSPMTGQPVEVAAAEPDDDAVEVTANAPKTKLALADRLANPESFDGAAAPPAAAAPVADDSE